MNMKETNDENKDESEFEDCNQITKIAKTKHCPHDSEIYQENNIKPMTLSVSKDFIQSDENNYVPLLYQITSSSTISTVVNIEIKVATNAGIHFIPQNEFELTQYTAASPGICHGTLAFHCRKLQTDSTYKITQSSCPSCRDDWKGIHLDGLPTDHKRYTKFSWTLKGKKKEPKIIYWRYGFEIGLLIIGKIFEPVFYFRYVQEGLVHATHFQQLICKECKMDLSFISNSKHKCYSELTDSSTQNCLDMKDKSYYMTKYVVLSFSRSSGGATPKKSDLIDEHFKMYRIGVRHIRRAFDNTIANEVEHGQRYHKIGQCNSTILKSNYTIDGFKSFLHISNNINKKFIQAKAIFLIMTVTSSFSSSPFYISQFLTSLNYPLMNIYFVVMNFKDYGRLNENDIRMSVQAADILRLCNKDCLYPFNYFGSDIETNAILNKLQCRKTKVSWQFFESLQDLQEERENVAVNGRNAPIIVEEPL